MRQQLGYVVLDLRSIQPDSTASHWCSLLNYSLAREKPALRVSLVTEEDKSLEQGGGGGGGAGGGNEPVQSNGQLMLTLNDKGGYYQLGAPSEEDSVYTISVTLSNPHALETVCADFLTSPNLCMSSQLCVYMHLCVLCVLCVCVCVCARTCVCVWMCVCVCVCGCVDVWA